MASGIFRTFQEDSHGLWKIPRLFWAEAPFSALSQGKGLLTHLSLGTRRVGVASWLPYLSVLGSLSQLGTLQNPGVQSGEGGVRI